MVAARHASTSGGLGRRHIIAGSAAFAAARHAGAQGATPIASIAIALSSNSFSTVAARMAARIGAYARHGLDARVLAMDNASAATSALLAGSVQFAVAGAGEVFAARTRGQDLVMAVSLYRGLSSAVVLAKSVADRIGVRPDAPIGDRLRALNGLVLASPSPTAVLGLSVQMAAKQLGAVPRMTYIGNAAMPAALENGVVAAMVAATPYWVTPVVRGAGVQWINCAAGELPPEVTPSSSGPLATLGSYARANPAVIRALRESLDDVAAFVANEPAKAQAVLAELYPELDAGSLALGFAKEAQNWTKPALTVEDVRHDMDMLRASGIALPGLDSIDPASVLLP